MKEQAARAALTLPTKPLSLSTEAPMSGDGAFELLKAMAAKATLANPPKALVLGLEPTGDSKEDYARLLVSEGHSAGLSDCLACAQRT